MPLCARCKERMPPDLCMDIEDGMKKCIFCVRDTNVITHNGTKITRQDIIKEYKMFCDELKDRADLLKDYSDGTVKLPERFKL